jgi:hypothetical protein
MMKKTVFFMRGLAVWVAGFSWGARELPAEPAASANDFLNSIGVCTHISQGIDKPMRVAACLRYLGAREIRDDGSTNLTTLQSFIDIHHASGTRVSLLPITGDIAKSLAEYDRLAQAGALLAAEGPNEPNNGAVTYQGATSSNKTALPTALFQRDLYRAVKGDPALAGIPVFASSEAGGSEPDNVGLQFLKIPADSGVTLMPIGTTYADYANTHNYVSDHFTELSADNTAWNAEDPTLRSYWDGLDNEYGLTWWSPGYKGYTSAQLETLPRVTTETGWVTQGKSALTEEQQGRLFLDLYFSAFKRGWTYTFIYMLRDDAGQGYWGLVHTDYTPKRSGIYLHNLTTILADKSSAPAGSLSYSIPNEPATVHDLLLQKSSGVYELAVWDEKASGSDQVSVHLPGTYPSVKIYDPTLGTTAIQMLKNVNAVPLTLSDHPLIIELPAHPSP